MNPERADREAGRIDVSQALREFLELEDAGLTHEKLAAFLERCEQRGPRYLEAVKQRLKLIAAAYEALGKLD